MSNNKIKGFFKGLKFITHKFESEKEPEMQIGAPTDVKHVAHIGWDGPSVNPPSWMSDFKGEGSDAAGDSGSDSTAQSTTRDLPKSSRRSNSELISRVRSERGKSRGSRRSSRHTIKDPDNAKAGLGYNSDPESKNPDGEFTKKIRRKKTRDPSLGSRKSRTSRTGSDSASGSGSGSTSKPNNTSSDGLP